MTKIKRLLGRFLFGLGLFPADEYFGLQKLYEEAADKAAHFEAAYEAEHECYLAMLRLHNLAAEAAQQREIVHEPTKSEFRRMAVQMGYSSNGGELTHEDCNSRQPTE